MNNQHWGGWVKVHLPSHTVIVDLWLFLSCTQRLNERARLTLSSHSKCTLSATRFCYISSGLMASFWRTISTMTGRPPSCGSCTKQDCAVTKMWKKMFFSLSPRITVATRNLLSLGWTCFCYHSMKKIMVFIQKSLFTVVLLLSLLPPTHPPTSASNLHYFPLCLSYCFHPLWIVNSAKTPACPELVYIAFTSSLATSVNRCESLSISSDICAIIVFNVCHLWLPLCVAGKNVLVSENLFKIWQKG